LLPVTAATYPFQELHIPEATADSKSLSSTAPPPFWLRLELNRVADGLQAARADVVACFGALLGDSQWNPHLSSVFTSIAHGRAAWAADRPLLAWLASLERHVTLLTKGLDDFQKLDPSQNGISLGIFGVYLLSYGSHAGVFHLRMQVWHNAPSQPRMVPTTGIPPPHMTADPDSSRASGPGSYASFPTSPHVTPEQLSNDNLRSVAAGSDAGMLVHGLHLIGAVWCDDHVAAAADAVAGAASGTLSYENEMPPVVVRLVDGPPPEDENWFSCPLVIAHRDVHGADIADAPVAHISIATSLHPALCTLHGVRLLSYA